MRAQARRELKVLAMEEGKREQGEGPALQLWVTADSKDDTASESLLEVVNEEDSDIMPDINYLKQTFASNLI